MIQVYEAFACSALAKRLITLLPDKTPEAQLNGGMTEEQTLATVHC
ncbi:MAG: hypothetical protein AAF519_06010 [Bacteroidota bacterium]